jgi:hypothetical protein
VKRALLRAVGGTALAALATLTIIAPAYGDTMRTDVTDLKVTVDPVHGKVGDTISVHFGLYDLGPSTAVEGTVTSHIVAPSGTELTDDFASRPYCHVATPGHEVSCANIAQFWPPEYVNNGALLDYGWTVHLKIVSPEVGPGRYDVTYANGDTDPGNNSAAIVVTVDGVTTSPSPRQSPTAVPRPAASPIHTTPQTSPTLHGPAIQNPSADISSSQSAATSQLAGPVSVHSTSDLIATTSAAHSLPIAPIAEAVLAVAFVAGVATIALLRWRASRRQRPGIQP